ncbi:hypothetical protein [Actinotignum urinale]|uniref:hypothetical protein n=1 Tax=Actinotignum urinale TaxID=190146 RepID=UPI00370D8020
MNTEPTTTFIDEYGYKTEEWRNNEGRLHREDGPATISYNPDGTVMCEAYYQHGQLHRDNGPATISYRDDGTVYQEDYCQNGKLHRENGPARIFYNQDGTTRHKEYWQGGKQYTPTTRDVKNTLNTKLEAIKQRNNTKTPVVKHDRKPGRTLS